MMFTITDYAMNRSGKLHGWFDINLIIIVRLRMMLLTFPVHEPKMWDDLKGQFMSRIDEVNADLKAAGRPPLGSELKQQ